MGVKKMHKVDVEYIWNKLSDIYRYYDDYARDLFITVVKNDYSHPGTYLFSLEGSPPKGYAMYFPESRMLIVYDAYGKRLYDFCDNIEIIDLPLESKVLKPHEIKSTTELSDYEIEELDAQRIYPRDDFIALE